MPKRFETLDNLNEYLDERNIKLLAVIIDDEEYEVTKPPTTKQKVKWVCGTCDREQVSCLASIVDIKKEVVECKSCATKRGRAKSEDAATNYITYDTFCDVLEERGWKMMSEKSEYKNTKSVMKVVCSEGHPGATSYNRFMSGCDCMKCDHQSRRGKNINDIRQEFTDKGFKLLEQIYINYDTPMKYRCKCGTESTMSYSNFKKVIHGCRECVALSQRKDWDEIVKLFSESGCKILSKESDYKDRNQPLKYKCSCGGVGQTPLKFFQRGNRCENCKDDRRRKTNMKKYDVPYIIQCPKLKQKMKDDCMKKYGVEYATKVPEIKQKIMNTNKKNHGGKHNFSIQTKELRRENYEKTKKTLMDKYGVTHNMQHPPFLKKQQSTAFSTKSFTFPSGRVEQVQGYEPFALNYLLDCGYDEDDIIVGCEDVPKIRYTFEDKNRVYYPDVYLKSDNTLVEIKSPYTMALEPEKIEAKIQASILEGYNVHVTVFDGRGNLVDEIMRWCYDDDSSDDDETSEEFSE